MLKSWLTKHNYIVDNVTSVANAIEMLKMDSYDMVLTDIRMPDDDGFSLLMWVKKYDSDIQVIMMTSFADVESAVESLKMGASDYISKPIDTEVLFQKIDDAFRKKELDKQAKEMYQYFIKPVGMDGSQEIHDTMIEVSRNRAHLLIIGNNGTGKSTAVKFLYIKGAKDKGPFVELDLNYPKSDIIRQNVDEKGVFEEYLDKAKGGLLHIRGLKRIDIKFQSSLIRALTSQNVDNDFTQIIISSTESKKYLKDNLMPKLSELLFQSYIELSTLAGKKKAIVSYSEFFLKMANKELNKDISKIDSEVYETLFERKWEENIQELKNLIFKMVLYSESQVISKESVKSILNDDCLGLNTDYRVGSGTLESFKKENFEKKKISEALNIAKGNKTLAATLLNIDRKTLYNKIRIYQI